MIEETKTEVNTETKPGAKPQTPDRAMIAIDFKGKSYVMTLELLQLSSHNHFDTAADPDYPCLSNAAPNGCITLTLTGKLVRDTAGS